MTIQTSVPIQKIELTNTFDSWRITLNDAIATLNETSNNFVSLAVTTNEVSTKDLTAESVQSIELYNERAYSQFISFDNGLSNSFFSSSLTAQEFLSNTINALSITTTNLEVQNMILTQLSANTVSSENVINQKTITTEDLIVIGSLTANAITQIQSEITAIKSHLGI